MRGRFLIGSSPEIGTRWPAHATSTGKVLLAAARYEQSAPADGPSRVKRPARLARLAKNTITSQARLDRELAKVWRTGYAVGQEEIEAGFVAIAAPVLNVEARTVAAISVGGPTVRISGARVAELGALVRAAADEVSRRLGAPRALDAAASPRKKATQ